MATRSGAMVLVAVLLAVGITACSDGGDSGDGAVTTSSSSSTTSVDQSAGTAATDRRVSLAFWPESQLDTTSGAPAVPDQADLVPRITQDFEWVDPAECMVWERTVAPAAGGGTRVNAATDFVLEREPDGTWVFTYRQNADRCGDEFATEGTVKTFRSDVLVVDPSTGQTGDPLWVAVVDVGG